MTAPTTEQILAAVMADREYNALTISPDGAVCGWVGRHEGSTALYSQDLAADGTPQGEPRILHAGPDLRGYVFLHDGEHVFLLLDATGDENTRALLIPRVPKSVSGLASGRLLTPEGAQCRLLGHKAADPTTVLIGLNLRDAALHDVHALDTRTGEITPVAENPGYVSWIIDHDARVRGGIRTEDDASVTICLDEFPGVDGTGSHPALRRHVPARRATAAVLGLVRGDGHDVLWLLEGCEPDSSTVTELHLLPEGPQPGRIVTSPSGSEFDGAWVRPGSGAPEILEHGRWSATYTPLDEGAADDLRRLQDALHDAGLLTHSATVDADRRDSSADRLWAVRIDPGTTSPRSTIWDRVTRHLHDLGPQLPDRDQLPAVRTTHEEFRTRRPQRARIPERRRAHRDIAALSPSTGSGPRPWRSLGSRSRRLRPRNHVARSQRLRRDPRQLPGLGRVRPRSPLRWEPAMGSRHVRRS